MRALGRRGGELVFSSVSGQADARLLANQLPRAVSLATPRLPDALTVSMPSRARFATVTPAMRTLVSRGDIHTPRCLKRVPSVKQAIRTARSAAESEAVGARVSFGARDRMDTDDTSSLQKRAPGITAGSMCLVAACRRAFIIQRPGNNRQCVQSASFLWQSSFAPRQPGYLSESQPPPGGSSQSILQNQPRSKR